jgi:hypothetical protein
MPRSLTLVASIYKKLSEAIKQGARSMEHGAGCGEEESGSKEPGIDKE